MSRKAVRLTVLVLAMLILMVAGGMFVNFGSANPFSQAAYSGEMVAPASANPPSVWILSPSNNQTIGKDQVVLTISAQVGQAPYTLPSMVFHGLSLKYVSFKADWLDNETIINGTSTFEYKYNSSGTSEDFYDNFYPRIIGSYLCTLGLSNIPEGAHTISVNATERGYYYFVEGGVSFHYYGFSKSTYDSINFTIDTTPAISFLSFDNTTIDSFDVPLNFTINQKVSQITYVMDRQPNITISGNTTITGLTNGKHQITLFATDETGHTGVSKTVNFVVAAKEPDPQPELFPPTLVLAVFEVLIGVVITGAVALLVCRKKRRH